MTRSVCVLLGLIAAVSISGCDALHTKTVALAVMPAGTAISDAGQKLAISAVINNAGSHPRVQWRLLGPGTIGSDDDCCARTESATAEGVLIHYIAAGPQGSYALISATSEQDPTKVAYLAVRVNAGISLDDAPLPDATLGKPYSASIKVNGGTGSKSLEAFEPLPDGLTFHRDSGMLSGTPTKAGKYAVHVLTRDESTARVGPTLTASINVTP